MSGFSTIVGGGLGGNSSYSIVDSSTLMPGATSYVGGAPTGNSDYTTRAVPTMTPLGTLPQTASTVVSPSGTNPYGASTVPTLQPFGTGVQGIQSATQGVNALAAQLAALGGGAGAQGGQVLYAHVAADPKDAAKSAAPKELEVKSGDTLSKLAEANGTTWEKLYELNKDVIGGDPNLIKPGQKLKLPGGGEAAPKPGEDAAAPKADAAAKPEGSTAPAPTPARA